MKMWAVVGSGQPLQYFEMENPEPNGAEVLVAVTHCGVCHSDLHFWRGEYDMGHGKLMRLVDRGVTLPRAPGHEVVGQVVAVGPDATGVKVGDRRIVYPWIGCGKCAMCLAGEDNMCSSQASIGVVRHGGFSSHVLVPHSRYLVDPGDLDPALASTFACSGITVLSAIRKLGTMDPDSPVLLVGAGGVGHAAITMLHALGHRNIIVVDVDEAKRQSALAAGATAVVDGMAEDVTAEIFKAAGGPVPFAIDFVNYSKTAKSAFESLAKGGKLVLVGVGGGELELSLAGMVFTARSVMAAQTGTLQDLKDVVALAQSGKLKPIPIEHLKSDDGNEALLRLKAGKVTGRLVIERDVVVSRTTS
ncbi:alcohol dehydrogenase [Noviherbaspirillum sedimenti]|uniref:alcohol dehydrogenase n=1 Tax=Noviherbaspirillum sedimenti TaxID=2320865 RepID=A0A3A3G4A0_9BURK|nr:alcohol dehydrogenase [Noviherbaspirillum sedimenti]RJG03308.1 alcohol dehydrogenase [Noviherbaspirillum sedimenti]